MKNMIEYKEYCSSINYSDEDRVFYGKVEYIRSLISYEGKSVENLQKSFQEAVDDYLKLCQFKGIEPEKPFMGSFNVRVGSELHRKAVLYAQEKGSNLNTLVKEALENYLDKTSRVLSLQLMSNICS